MLIVVGNSCATGNTFILSLTQAYSCYLDGVDAPQPGNRSCFWPRRKIRWRTWCHHKSLKPGTVGQFTPKSKNTYFPTCSAVNLLLYSVLVWVTGFGLWCSNHQKSTFETSLSRNDDLVTQDNGVNSSFNGAISNSGDSWFFLGHQIPMPRALGPARPTNPKHLYLLTWEWDSTIQKLLNGTFKAPVHNKITSAEISQTFCEQVPKTL